MINLSEMSISDLELLIENCKKEVASRTCYSAEFKLGGKAYMPCTYEQIKFADSLCLKTNSLIQPNNSQLMKYFSKDDMSEAIKLMLAGERIKINQ